MSRPKILAFAYACEPDRGSEPGAGWAWVRMIARTADVWVITRRNNRSTIEGAIARTSERETLHFVYVDLPAWARFWKRGQRGIRVYYLLWQVAALQRARALNAEVRFDGVWHLTLANAWLGSVAPLVGPPTVIGPIGGGVGTVVRLLPALGPRGAVFDILRGIGRALGRYLNPLARSSWRKAAAILVQNQETREWLPARHREKASIVPNVVLFDEMPTPNDRRRRSRTALFAGRLVQWKGVGLAIRAIALTPGWDLVVCGTGRDERRLVRLARRVGVQGRVRFVGWLKRDDLFAEMRAADAFLYPSIHDDAGWAVAEAMSCGLPVVCIDRGGPPTIAGPAAIVVPAQGGERRVAKRLASALGEIERNRSALSEAAHRIARRSSLDVRARLVADVISRHLVIPVTGESRRDRIGTNDPSSTDSAMRPATEG